MISGSYHFGNDGQSQCGEVSVKTLEEKKKRTKLVLLSFIITTKSLKVVQAISSFYPSLTNSLDQYLTELIILPLKCFLHLVFKISHFLFGSSPGYS